MTLFEKIKARILKFLGLEHLSDNPNDARYTFINDDNTVKKQHQDECRIWYVGDSDELQNFYTNRDMSGNAKEPIYNRNKANYFWGIAVDGNNRAYKKVHSGVPRAIIDTLSNAIGMPLITSENEELNKEIKEIMRANDFKQKLTQEARPLTLVEGWGAWKVNFNTEISDYPTFQYYEGKDVDFIVKSGVLIGIVYRDYYTYKNKNYVLLETRRIADGNSYIEFELYLYGKENTVTKVPLDTIDELANLPEKGYVIKGVKKVMGVPCKYFYDLFNKEYGRSIFTGKLDIFDDIDQCLSQASQTDKVSTPVEYWPSDLLEHDGNGHTVKPSDFDRHFIELPVAPNGDGETSSKVITTQPNLNYDQYIQRYKSLIDIALTGILSPASMGFDVSKKDNAEAQREKEKVTILTRNNVMDAEDKQLKDLFSVAFMMKEYIKTNNITVTDYQISVKYSEFANPTFESMTSILLPLYNSSAISPEMFVEKLYGDSISDAEKKAEVEKIVAAKQKSENFGLEVLE